MLESQRGERNATIESLAKVIEALGVTFLDIFRFPDNDNRILNDIIDKLSKRSIKDQEIISNLIDVLPPLESDKNNDKQIF